MFRIFVVVTMSVCIVIVICSVIGIDVIGSVSV